MATGASASGGTAGRPRDGRVIAAVGLAHYGSHVMQLALPPLFPLLHDRFGVSFAELGLIVTVFFVTSGLGQAAAGVLVDRYGAHRLLVGGLALSSAAVALASLAPGYWALLPLAVLGGLGNSVFHPADLSILSHRVSEGRLGRAYAVHNISGALGYATAPVAVAAIAAVADWRVALLAVGAAGLAGAGAIQASRSLMVYDRPAEAPARPAGARPGSAYLAAVGSPVILMAFAYFILTSFAFTGIQSFGVTTLNEGYGLALRTATLGLTAFLIGGSLGTAAGGILADRTTRHSRVAVTGITVAGGLMLLLPGLGATPAAAVPLLALAGMAAGVTAPSRDVLVRRAAAGGLGSVFGFVYSGFDLGASVAPLVFGTLLDRHAAPAVFMVVAGAFLLAAPAVLQIRRGPAPASPQPRPEPVAPGTSRA